MQFLDGRHGHVGVPSQIVKQPGGAGLLRTDADHEFAACQIPKLSSRHHRSILRGPSACVFLNGESARAPNEFPEVGEVAGLPDRYHVRPPATTPATLSASGCRLPWRGHTRPAALRNAAG